MHEIFELIRQIQALPPSNPSVTVGYGRDLNRTPLDETEAATLLLHDLERKKKWLYRIQFLAALDPVRYAAVLFLLHFYGEAAVFGNEPLLAAIRTRSFALARRYLPKDLQPEHMDLITSMFERGEFPE